MKKYLIGGVVGLSMLLPLSAFAATNITNLTLDGLANTTANVGDTVNAQVTYDITSNDDVESLSWEIVGTGLPQTCVDIPDQINSGTFHPTFDIDTAGATAGTFDVKIKLFGENGAGADQLCQNSMQVDSMSFTNRIAITESSSNSTGVGSGTGHTNNSSGSGVPAWFSQFMVLLGLTRPATTPASTVNAKCTAIAPYLSAPTGTYSSLGTQLQSSLLLDNPFSIPALQPGSTVPMGFRGPQTNAALATYNANYHCN